MSPPAEGAGPPARLDPPPAAIDCARSPLPPPVRTGRTCTVLDITKFFGETTGGIRTYLTGKARYVRGHPELGQVLVVPGERDGLVDDGGTRCYRLRGPQVPCDPAYRLLLSPRVIRRLVEHERPDLIELGSAWLVPWLVRYANRRCRVPVVWFYHTHLPGIAAPPGAGSARRAAGALAWKYVRQVASRCRAVLVASDTVADELEHHGVPGVRRITLGVDLAHFHPDRRRGAAETRRRLGLPEGPLALYLGRLAGEKQLETVLDAWPEIQRRTGAALAVAGGGPAERGLRRRAQRLRVRWLPFERDRERVADLLAAVDLYLAPGPAETFGLSALEAMASATPVLSVDAGPVADRVRESGAGALYAPGDPGACATAATGLFQADLAGRGRAARTYAVHRHDATAAFDRLFVTYREILGAGA